MSATQKLLGERAIVLGAGIAGTLVARVLSDHFARVTVLERDGEADADGYRKGVPQAKMVHAVLRAGLDSMNRLFPGFEQDLIERGAVPCRSARDLLFIDGLGIWPRRDVGVEVPLMTRPLLEQGLRRRLASLSNVELRGNVNVQALIADGERVVGVSCRQADGTTTRELGDLVVDATGRAAHTVEWLRRIGFTAPEETRVEVDISYACCFVRPRPALDLRGMMLSEPPPHGRYGCLINAQEGDRMIVGIGSRGRDTPQADDYAGLLALAERLPHPQPFELMRDAEPLTPVARFGFPASVHHHYERLERVPAGFLCIGDAICSFNPIWGQGMSVAALEVDALGRMLTQRADDAASLDGLPAALYAEAARIIETPWTLSVMPDLAYDTTRGAGRDAARSGGGFTRALAKLALQDGAVQALLGEIYHMVKPREALFAPELVARVMPLIEKELSAPNRRLTRATAAYEHEQ